ncbi:MAG: prepilin-type N-terminal cleavage/methylation domain-containing protein [Planctomycetes bacterium]|nr:prepilin-type N-terminal cleavage/methylation domain-containing protein [Planctomycetota bacterium]
MTHRGLTLVEVLASTVLLVVIATVCLPTITAAREHLAADPDAVPVDLLGAAADEFMAEPESHGVESLPELEQVEITTSSLGPIVVTHVEGPMDSAHVWLRFSAGTTSVFRWVRLPEEEAIEEASP